MNPIKTRGSANQKAVTRALMGVKKGVRLENGVQKWKKISKTRRRKKRGRSIEKKPKSKDDLQPEKSIRS